jgi:hypothetical protein
MNRSGEILADNTGHKVALNPHAVKPVETETYLNRKKFFGPENIGKG